MMGNMNIKIKIMPSSPETDLEELKNNIKKLIENNKGNVIDFEEEPIAFGLKAVIASFIWPEEKELDTLEDSIEKMENVASEKIIDMRRSIG